MKKVFTSLVICLPILTVYKSPVPGVDLATLLMLLFAFVYFLSGRLKFINIKSPLLFFLLFLLFLSSVSFMLQGVISDIALLRTGKLLFLVLFVFVIGYDNLFDKEFAIKALNAVTAAAAIYIILQTVAYHLFGLLLPSGILPLVTDEAYSALNYAQIAKSFYRPSSFFIEPAYFAQYAMLGLCINIFGFKKSRLCHNLKMALLISAGIILSASGQGVLLAAFLWLFWLVQRLIFTNFSVKKLFILLAVAGAGIVFIPMLLETELVSKTLSRVFDTNTAMGGNALLARTHGYSHFQSLPLLYKTIGVGYGNVPPGVYLNGAAYILYTLGISGAAVMLFLFADAFVKGKPFGRVFLAAMFGMLLVANIFTAAYLCFYFSFIYIGRYKTDTDVKLTVRGELT